MSNASTHAAASNLLTDAHDREDPLVLAEAQLHAGAIAAVLDQTVDAYRDGKRRRMQELRDDVRIAVLAFAELVRAG